MRFKTATAVVGALLLVASTTGCGTSEQAADNGATRVAIILGGQANDGGFNQSGAAPLDELSKEGKITTQVRQGADLRQAEAYFQQFAEEGYDLVIGWSATFSASLYRLSTDPRYTKTKFLITGDSSDKQKPSANVENWAYDNLSYGYLLGWIAAQAGLSPIGIIDGEPLPAQRKKWAGFALGVKAVQPNAEVREPTFIGNWKDTLLANQAATTQIGSGVRMIATNAEGFTPGIVSAAVKAGNVATIGIAPTASPDTPRVNIGRVKLDMTALMRKIIDRVKDGSFGNQTSTSSIANRSLVLDDITKVEATPALPADLQPRAQDLAQQIADGKIKIGS
ncbi:BMP family ABC transporter substrate-binding protein [Amycolatopsis azurea]|uniref:BMP family ABC transporter substrate-binding protein n=1 Tax=Amycolatopsis azurea TaxID=36819 RepID=UPI003818BF45